MKSRKISRVLGVVAVAFVIATALAVSALAYSVTANGTVAGLADGVTYTVAQYDFANDTYGEFTALTADTQLTSGVWGISANGGEPEVLYVQGDDTGKFTSDVDNATEEAFVQGKWTTDNENGAISGIWHYAAAGAMALNTEKSRFFSKNGDDWSGATPLEGEANMLQESLYTYGYTNNKVFPASAFNGYASLAYFSNPSAINEKYTAAEFKPEMILYTKKVGSSEINTHTVAGSFTPAPSYWLSFSAPSDLPTDEYVVAIGFAPYANLPDDFYSGFSAGLGENLVQDYHFLSASVSLKAPKVAPDAPVLISVDSEAKITIDNYNTAYSYQYSDDEGNTWIPINANSFSAAKASHEYMVKIVESDASAESDIAYVTSAPLTVVGKSLVLDGMIGTRVYIDVDESVLNVGTLAMDVSLSIPSAGVWESSWVTTSRSLSYATSINYDEATGYYYVTFFIPAKDYNKTDFYTGLHCNGIDGAVHNYGGVGSLRIDDYINAAKALAEAGDEAFIAAYDLVVATENYVKYADNYFNKGSLESYKTANEINIEAPARSNAELDGIRFYGTSLILEDKITIRHYFEVTDMDAFLAADYKSGIDYAVHNGFICYDITDIPAQSIGEIKTLVICDSEYNVIYTVDYSVANYIHDMANTENVGLASLVNAMYDYYIEAYKFVN